MTEGILAVWTDADPAAEDDFNDWYNREHMFERVDIPGFHRARRYLTVSGSPKYFAYYVTDGSAVMASEAYLERLNNPSPWTERNIQRFRNTNRTACTVLRRLGRASGAAALTIRLAAEAGREDGLVRWLAEMELPAIAARPAINGTQLWRADRDSTLIPTEERAMRPEPDQIADLVIFVEATDAAGLAALSKAELSTAALVTQGASASTLQRTIHQLLCAVEKDDLADV